MAEHAPAYWEYNWGSSGTERTQTCFSSDWASNGEKEDDGSLSQKPTSYASLYIVCKVQIFQQSDGPSDMMVDIRLICCHWIFLTEQSNCHQKISFSE